MDKDEHFKSILDNLCCCSLDQFFDSEKFKEELILINSNEVNQDIQSDSYSLENNQLKDSNSKQSDLEKMAILKNYSAFLEEQIYSQETLRENEEKKIEFIIQYLNKIIGSEEKYFSRKLNLFSKVISSYYTNKKSINKLEFNYEPLLIEYSLMPNFSLNSLPGLKPLSNWPISLGDLWDKLKIIKLEELFNQPIEEKFKEEFYNEAIQQITNFDNSNDIDNLSKAISCFLCILILFGDYLLLFKGIINLKINIKNKKSLDESIFKDKENPLILKIQDLYKFLGENDFNLYPIMRNYSLVDYFTINKSFLYSQTKSTYYNSCCCCTDGTYIYIFMSGIDGCKLKIGTGFNNTVKGKVYLCVQNKEESGSENYGANGNQWVYCNGKIYQKVNRVGSSFESNILLDYKNNIGRINVINPENFKVENKIRLLFPQNALNELILYRNQNYILLSDGKKLSVLCLELVKNNEKINNKDVKVNPNSKDDQLVYKYINLELIDYDITNLNYNTEEYQSKISPQNKKLIDEIYQSFSLIFTKEECFKALLKNNWNPKETALYLIDNPSEIKQSLLIGEKPIILFQSKIESQNIKSGGKCEFKFYNNTYFDCYHYDSFKWCLDENFAIAYKLGEGAAAIFGRDPTKYGKIFNYEIEIKKFKNNAITFPTFIGSKSKAFPKIQKKDSDFKDSLDVSIKNQYDILKKYIEQGRDDKLLDEFDKDFIGLLEIENNLIKKSDSKTNDINKNEDENNDDKNQNDNNEDKIVDEIYGTLIKKTSSLSLTKNNFILTYDIENKVYYIMVNAVVNLNSFSILISDTFDNMNKEYKLLFNLGEENFEKTKKFFTALPDNAKDGKITFDNFANELLNILYLISTSMKYDTFWRYKNWSYYYNHLLDFINNRYQEQNNNIDQNIYLLPIFKQYPMSKKSLNKRIDKFNDYNKDLIVMQLDKELNEDYKLKDIPETENTRKYSMYNASPNKKNLGNWISTTSLMFKYKYQKDKKGQKKEEEKTDEKLEEKVKNYVMSFIDKRIYLTNKRIFFLSMKGDINEINYILELLLQKKQNNDYIDFISLELLFKLIYIWVTNIDITLILTNKKEFQEIINKLNSILKEYYKDNNLDNKIKSLIRLIILEGWNELVIDLEEQIYWFKDFYNYNKNIDDNDINKINDLNLEYYTLSLYEKYPFYCLLKKLDYTRNSLCINNNFNKINAVKAFNFYPIIYKKKYRLIAIPSFHGFSSINMQIPFYWILLNFDINYYQNEIKEKIKPIVIDVDYKGSERYSPPYKGVVVDYKLSKINKILYEKIHLKTSLILYNDFINNEEIKLNFENINKDIWQFFNDNFKDNKLINLLNKSLVLCLGEITVLYKNYNTIIINFNENNDGSLLSKFKDYVIGTGINKKDNLNKVNFNIEKENIDEKRSELKEKFKEVYLSFFNNLQKNLEKYINLNENINDNFELLKLNVDYIYFIFHGIKNYIFNNDESNLKLLLSSLKTINKFEINEISLNNELGNIHSKTKVFEYNLSNSELVNINQTISFNSNNELFCVELELQIANNEKLLNKDLLIVSDYHGYRNVTFYMNNYVSLYGTSFNIKLNRSFKKVIFLKGTEIKIISPSDNIKSHLAIGNENNKNNSDNYLNQFNNRTVLKIKVYPYNNHSLSIVNKNQELNEKRLKNISLSIITIEEIEYYLAYIFKHIIKSTDIDKNDNENILLKYDILKLGLKDDFYKNIDEQFEKEKNKYKKNTNDENKIEFIKNYLEKDKTSLTSLKNSNIDADLYIFKLILIRIRKVSKEPITYINIKRFPSFNKEIKELWEKVEILLLYAFLYHLNLINDFKDAINNNDNDVVDNALELILGKRLNIIMSNLSNKALLYKDSFDLIKNFFYDFEEEFNKLYEEIKQIIIQDIYDVHINKDNEKNLEEKEDVKDTKDNTTETKHHEKKEKKKKDKLAELKEKFGSKDDTNYKKKKNAPRTLYQEKKKKKKGNKNSEKEKNNIEEEKLKKKNEEEEKYNNLNSKTLEQLINESPVKISDEINNKIKVIKNLLTNKYKSLIKDEINLRYFGNKEKLKSICETYKIEYNDNNPNESMDKYSTYIFNEIYGLVKDNNGLNKIVIDEKELNKKNPFVFLADEMIYKISLLINLNNYNENNENEEFNLQLTERMKSFNSSFNLALHSNNSSSFQNISNKNLNPSPDENYVLDPKMQYILKSLVHYIIKYSDNVNKAIILLYTQYIRSKTRILGICNLSEYLKKDLNCYTNYNYGLLSLAVGKYKNGLLNNIESNNRVMNDIKNELITLLEKNINILINLIKEYEKENSNTNNNKIVINLSKIEIDNNFNSEENNSKYYLTKKIILLLSDIHIILKYISSHRHLFEEDLTKINLEKFIDIIFNILMNKKKNNTNESEEIRKIIKEMIKIILDEIILLNNQKSTDYIFGHLYEYLCTIKEKSYKKNMLELIRNILLNYNKVSQNNPNINYNSDSNIIKISSKLLEFIESSNTPEIINISSQIIIYIYKSISQKGKKEINNLLTKDTEVLFKKIGKLFMFEENHKLIDNNSEIKENDNDKSENYYILVEMNSTEFDYQFLVNALYYWEEKYPTELSKYKYETDDKDKEKEKEKVEDKDKQKEKDNDKGKKENESKIEYNSPITVENKYNVKLFNYFNTYKGEKGKVTHKMTKLYKVVDDKLDNVRKTLEHLEKASKDPKTKQEDIAKNSEKIKNIKKNLKYYHRIKAHLKLAEEIGEIASIKGYVILLPKLPHKKALELCDLFYKANNRLLKNFSSEVDNNEPLFSDQLIFPPLPNKTNLLAGLTTTLMETTKSNLNFTLVTEKEYDIISETYDYFSKELKKNSILDEKREKFGKYHDNYMLGYSKVVINSVNYNSYDKKIIEEDNILTGKCITIIIQSIIELLYNIYELNSSVIIKLVRNKLKQIKNDFNFKSTNEENLKIIGMFLYINNFYNIIRQNTKVTNSNNKDNETKIVGKVISGGDKSGSNTCKVCFTNKNNNLNKNNNYTNLRSNQNRTSYNNNEEDLTNRIIFRIESVNINSLNKLDENEDLIKCIPLSEIFDIFIFSYENYKNFPIFDNQILLHLSLKLLNNKKLENSEISRLCDTNKNIIIKVLDYLQEISNLANWIEKKDKYWESEFIESFERLQNKFNIDNKKLIGIYSPIFNNITNETNEKDAEKENKIDDKEKKEEKNKKEDKKEDLIVNYNMSKSDFITELPQLKDYSKITSSMRNIIIFERYFVGEIYHYCRQQYNENDYVTSLSQIRYQIAIGDLNGLKNDMSAVFDNGKIPITGPLFREQFDTNEIFVQELYPNNYYCARINKIDTPVLVLFQDYTIGYCLCLIFDDYKGRMFTQWINSEDLKLLPNPIKIPSFSFNYNELIKEYNYLEKKLRILYSKNALSELILSLNKLEFDIPLKDNNNLFELQLNNWKKFKLNPTSGVFKELNNFILMKNNSKIQRLLSNVKSDQNNLDELINNSLLGFDNNEEDKKIINNNENKINKSKNEYIKKWVINEWENLGKNLKTITVNLYKDYIEKSNVLFNTKNGNNIYHLSNFNNRLLALHELVKSESNIDTSDICGILITFKDSTALEANAKLTFYSDPYGENVIGEITSFKTITSNLPTYIFNYPKVWLKYTPGTRCFYIYEWSTVEIGSDLPCLITAIPCNWPLLIQLTDTITNDLFSEENNNDNNTVDEYKKLIHLLINHCTSNYIPSEIQRRIFNITTRTLFKYKQYIKINGDGNDDNIEKKIDLISTDKGKDLVDLIKKVEKTSENKNNNEINNKYCSSYVVEGVEIILAILSIIKGPKIDISIISKYLNDKFNYNLPIFIIAIDKLNQLIDFINNTNENVLEKTLIDEMEKENDLTNFIFNNIIILKIKDDYDKTEPKKEEQKKEETKKEEPKKEDEKKEEPKKEEKKDNKDNKNKDKPKKDKKEKEKESNKINLKDKVIQLLKEHEVIIVNADDDILEFNYNNEGKIEKYLGIAFDGFILSDKNLKTEEEKVEEKKIVEEEDPLWVCFYCKMENDKSNSFCVFCDKDKKVLPKEKPKPKIIEKQDKSSLGPPNNFDMALRYNQKKMVTLLKKLNKIEKEPFEKIYSGEEIISLPDYPGPLNNYLFERFNKYRNNKDYYLPKLAMLKKLNDPNIEENLKQISCENEVKCEDILDVIMNCMNNGIDFWFDYINFKNLINNKQKEKNIDLSLLTKISDIIDNAIISNQIYNKIEDYVLFLPSNQIRCINPSFNNFNQTSRFLEMNEIPLNIIRYYWSIVKYYNNCLKTSLPYIKPPSPYKTILKNSTKSDYILVPLHETISTFLTNTRGLIFNSIKTGLLNSIIDSSEFSEEEIQIPEMKFERLEIASNIDKKKNEVMKMIANNINYTDVVNDQRIDNINIKNLLKNNLSEKDSLFLQAFNQYKYYDISSYRSKKFAGDPKVAFKVIFKNEFVQGIGGPYRQFFSDISKELNEYLPLIIETQNNINNKGEYKDCYTINPSYNGINALDQYEFLGVLMGICIRTGVHLTLDLCSLVWKQIVNEKINLDDIFQYDEGIYNIIKLIYYYDQNKESKDKEKNEINSENNNGNKNNEIDNNPINKDKEEIENVFNYSTILSDGSVKYFYNNLKEKKELILDKSTQSERIKYISMLIYNRINEAEIQINSIRNGLSKIIPLSILQLFTGKELSMLVCGKKEVDIDLLHQNTKLSSDLREDSKEVRWLWEILHEMSPEEKIKFIKFCWAQERLPTSNEEYVKNQIVFTIKYNKNERNKNGFPKADTCFFNLELPNYTAKDIMKKNLLIAIGLDNNSMNADKITGINSGYISNNQRGNNRDDYGGDEDYDNYDGNYQMESCDEEGYMS